MNLQLYSIYKINSDELIQLVSILSFFQFLCFGVIPNNYQLTNWIYFDQSFPNVPQK